MKELTKTLKSGKVLVVKMAPWEEAHQLYKSIMSVIGAGSLNLDTDILPLVARMTTSPEVEQALWACMARSLYSGAKVTKATFEDEKAREDYLIIAKEVLVFNLGPFFKNLASLFPGAPVIPGLNSQE